VILALLAAHPASAASFRCAKAKLPDEKAICADRRLNDLDVELAVRLDVIKHLVPMGTRGALMDDQQAWLSARHQCGGDHNCLTRRYNDRLEEINGALQRVYGKGPF
jgi:uncharacterized protein